MGQVWTEENRYRAWLEVELAICEARAGEGEIPSSAMEEIRSKAAIDVDRILAIEETTRHDVIAFLTSLEEKIGPSSRYIHKGCTSSDIVDTANALLVQQAGKMIWKNFCIASGSWQKNIRERSAWAALMASMPNQQALA